MNSARMTKIARMYPKMSITKIAKTLENYSMNDDPKIVRRAVIRAIRWLKSKPTKKVWWNGK